MTPYFRNRMVGGTFFSILPSAQLLILLFVSFFLTFMVPTYLLYIDSIYGRDAMVTGNSKKIGGGNDIKHVL